MYGSHARGCIHGRDDLQAEVDRLTAENERLRKERDDAMVVVEAARGATKRLVSTLIANASRLDTPFSNAAGSPWSTFVLPRMHRLREALGMSAVDALPPTPPATEGSDDTA